LKELISVIVPIFNVEKYLVRCILSISNQTYKNLEIILVDDGSQDNCSAICDFYAKSDLRIKVIHKINGGLSSARNAGLDIATGKYVSFVDSDDSVSLEYIEVLFTTLKKTNSQISVGNILTVNSIGLTKNTELILNDCVQIFSPSDAVMNMYKDGMAIQFITVWGNLYEMDFFKSLRFPHGKINEDEFLNYKLFFLADRIAFNRNKIYYYLVRENSIMKSTYSLKRLDVLQAFEERVIFFKQLSEFHLMNESLNYYFHHLLAHLRKVKKDLPNEKFILSQLSKKFRDLSITIILSRNVSFKYKLVTIKYLIYPSAHKLNL
jgi:glycosyltransferase involved in cell wall biosynthesis